MLTHWIRQAADSFRQADAGFPVVGHALDFRRDPLKTLEALAGDVDAGSMRLGGVTLQVVGSPHIADHVMRTGAKNFNRQSPVYKLLGLFLGQGILVAEGEHWRKHRRVVQPAFHKRRLAALSGELVRVIDAHVSTWEGVFDTRDAMMRLMLELASSVLLGVPTKADADRLGDAIDTAQGRVQQILPFPGVARFKALTDRMMDSPRVTLDEVAFRLIRERRAEMAKDPGLERNDALGMLLEARYEDGSPLPDRQIRDELMTLLVAGHETTSNAVSWTLWFLAEHPAVRREMEAEVDRVLGGRTPTLADVQELKFTRDVLDESLRLRPPAWLTGRVCTKTHDHMGVHFEEGDPVLISPYVVHRRPEVYENPNAFDPSRWAGIRGKLDSMAFFPFGGGARKCVGEAFAYLEATLALAMITQRMQLHLEPGHDVVPMPQITLGLEHGLWMRATPRTRPEVQATATR